MNIVTYYAGKHGMDVREFLKHAMFTHVGSGIVVTSWDRAVLGASPTDGEIKAAIALPEPAIDLQTYAKNVARKTIAGGVSVNVSATGKKPVVVHAALDGSGHRHLIGAMQLALVDPSHVFDWVASPPLKLSSDQMKTLGVAASKFIQDVFSQLAVINAGILAGKVTSTAQIDSAAWPKG